MRWESMYPGVSQIYTPHRSVHLCYPCISIHPPHPAHLCHRWISAHQPLLSPLASWVAVVTRNAFSCHNMMALCSCRKSVPSRVTLPFLLCVQSELCFQGFRHLLCRFTGPESTETMLVTLKLIQITLHVFDLHLSKVPVLCHTVEIHDILDAHQGFCEGKPLAPGRVKKSRRKKWKNQAPECFHLLTTPFHHLAIWLVASSKARIWGHHHRQLVEFANPRMLLEEGCYWVH